METPILIEDLGMLFPTEKSTRKARFGTFSCSCGNEFKTQIGHVKNGNTKSCGCHQKQIAKSNRTTHNLGQHRLYQTWHAMVKRCTNPKSVSYATYGAKGITVCDRWLQVDKFIEDMYSSFQEGLTLDRIDNSKGYFKENCRWASAFLQQRNTNRLQINNTSGYRGVSFSKSNNKWQAQITVDCVNNHLGLFHLALDAAKAYDLFVLENKLEHTLNNVVGV